MCYPKNTKFKMKVLLINTNSEELKFFASFLSKNGHQVLIANEFVQGVNIALQKTPDVVVLFLQADECDYIDFAVSHIIKLPCKFIINNKSGINTETPECSDNLANVLLFENINETQLLELCNEQTKTTNNFSDKKILLIEDNALIRMYFNAILDKLNISYKICEGFVTALNELNKDNYNLIVADVNLKDGNGIELLRRVQSSQNPIPFIIISGYHRSEVEEKYGAFEAFGFITKPIEEKIFTSMIEKALRESVVTNTTKYQKVYDSTLLFKLLKNDTNKIKSCLDEYIGIVETGLKTIPSISDDKLDDIRPLFHDLLNLSNYFGAQDLIEMIMNYRAEKSIAAKSNLLKKINTELHSVFNYYHKFPLD